MSEKDKRIWRFEISLDEGALLAVIAISIAAVFIVRTLVGVG